MDTIGTEVGQKMRSAVKAKLIELGTGYIDDELPDYVMIMVANKRSKQQMTEDLNLFLGSNTEPFVSWLHQVLQKLQEVTLPPATASTSSAAKRKTSSSESNDKKKKDKKLKRSHKTKPIENAETAAKPATPPPPSITDVFADHLIQKAKTNLMLEVSVNVKTKSEQPTKDSTEKNSSDNFDIPTITEIAENEVVKVNRRKELSDLAELQKQINKAKRHLRSLGSEESEDEDFVNIEDDDDLGEDDEDISKKRSVNANVVKPAKVGDKISDSRSQRVQITYNENELETTDTNTRAKRMSVMERLGVKTSASTNRENVISLSANRRVEQEMYVPVFRRKEDEKKPKVAQHDRTARSLRSRDREIHKESVKRDVSLNSRELVKDLRSRDSSRGLVDREINREIVRDLRERVGRSKIVEESGATKESPMKLTAKQRIGSRVIVAPPKPEYEDTTVEVPVNSVIRVKPRPIIPSSKQASKNLLLKAVAEAQKSTAMVKPRPESPNTQNTTSGRTPKLFTKSFRDNSRIGKVKKNIVIEVSRPADQVNEDEEDVEECDDEYVTAMISDVEDFEDEDAYSPQNLHAEDNDQGAKRYAYQPATDEQTKFVVTLNADKYVPSSKAKGTDRKRVEINGAIQSQSDKSVKRPVDGIIQKEKERTSSPLRMETTVQKVNKLIIKNDTEDEEELRKEVERSANRKRSHLSPIRFDLSDEKRSKLRDGQPDDEQNFVSDDGQKVMIRRSDVSKKYDNLPPLLNSISLSDKSKAKERCKFYPSCGKGDQCEFVHPTSPCKVFPNCKFGDKCLYIHPK
ncbi:Zinc finger CCCH domain-containing protein 14, partial [Pseudolycoriella hygida]